jgi:hypothetical protein
MRVQALLADTQRPSFPFENGQSVEGFNDRASFRLIKGERYYALSDGILRGFDAIWNDRGVRFEHRGVVRFHPFVICVHCRSFPRAKWQVICFPDRRDCNVNVGTLLELYLVAGSSVSFEGYPSSPPELNALAEKD